MTAFGDVGGTVAQTLVNKCKAYTKPKGEADKCTECETGYTLKNDKCYDTKGNTGVSSEDFNCADG